MEKPARVIINQDGEAVSADRAESRGVVPDIIFKREDGWTLGTPKEFENVAYEMWADSWTHFALATDTDWTPISKYPRKH
jgi:hypothetical protein